MITSGASIAARHSATRAGKTPSGTAAPSVTRLSSWGIQPTGVLVTGRTDGPSSTPDCSSPISANSVTRQAVSRILTKRNATSIRVSATSATRTPVSRPVNSSRGPSGNTCTPTSAPRPDTSARPSSRPNQNRPPSSASRGSARIAASSSPTHARTSASPPARPDSGEATILRTRSCVADGSSPALATASATAATSRIPRNWTLPRAVSSSVAEPKSLATLASVASCAAVIIPPGSRIRASAPSAAWCGRNAPGQASASRVPATRPPYGRMGRRLAALRSRREAEDQGQGVFDCAHRGGFEGAESLHESGTSDRADAAAHRDAIGSYTF
ncbi:Uncharacterised protein [Mycobacterium tuberculosis]|nr:Uncharacterised protein [Mycobacterium tuberculosis]